MKPFQALLLGLWIGLNSTVQAAQSLSPNLTFFPGSINRAQIGQDSLTVAVYGRPPAHLTNSETPVLLTHARRDAMPQSLLDHPPQTILAPASEKNLLAEPHVFWAAFTEKRFHDYAQQSTKILAVPLPVSRWVREGDRVDLGGFSWQVLDTPGYTRGAVSYLVTVDGEKLAFTGDLIYGKGQILDLYSFQDAIPEAQIGGYHGYGGRLAQLIESLRRIKAAQPDLIIPARGPIIRNPPEAIDRLIGHVQNLYRNYLSTIALHWYFKEDRMGVAGRRVLGPDAEIELMPYALHQEAPDWIFNHSTSRLLISDDGYGFLLDCGYQRVIDAVQDLIQKGLVKKVEGLFVTHFHDDHSDMVQKAAEIFQCPVYATTDYKDVLEHPEAYHLPAMTAHPIRDVQGMTDGATMAWREFELTYHFYPGQTYYHGALLVKKKDAQPVFFIGDSFAPSGIDDYCVLNRNLLHEDSGYLLCLSKLDQVGEPFWLINEHIPQVFRFSSQEQDYLKSRYRQRIDILKKMLPWDDPNYGIDEQWAVFYPYGATLPGGALKSLEVRLENHSPIPRTFQVTPRGWNGLKVMSKPQTLTLNSREKGRVPVTVQAPSQPGQYLVTADVSSEGMAFANWIEALITVE